VVAALVMPADDYAEAALNATPEERQFAADLTGWLAELYGVQAATLGGIAEMLRPYWDPGATLMDAMAEAPPEVRREVLHWLTLSGLLPDGGRQD
jgi:hypothetical protein